MNTHPMKLVTIVCEAYALDAVKKLLPEVGAHGCTHFPVEGDGAGGARTGEMKEFANVQIEIVLTAAAASARLARIEKQLIPRDGMIVFESEVRVLRAGKF